jgi:hypothetical protein
VAGPKKDELDKTLEAFGLIADDDLLQPKNFIVWDENAEILSVFLACCTQWRTSMSGIIGLDYGALFNVMAVLEVADRRKVFQGVQVMEFAALEKLSSEKK